MARQSANRRLGLLLVVITAALVVITAGCRAGLLGDASSLGRSTAPGGSAAANHAASTSTAAQSATRKGHSATIGAASPAKKPVVGTAPTALIIRSPQGRRILTAPVDPLAAHRTSAGSWAAFTPPSLTRAAWMSQSASPASPPTGATAIYGHACLGIDCVFNNLHATRIGSTLIVETHSAVFRYRVISLRQYPKSGANSLASRANTPGEVLLITCAYRPDHTSVNNLVVTATLRAARPR